MFFCASSTWLRTLTGTSGYALRPLSFVLCPLSVVVQRRTKDEGRMTKDKGNPSGMGSDRLSAGRDLNGSGADDDGLARAVLQTGLGEGGTVQDRAGHVEALRDFAEHRVAAVHPRG